MNIYEKSDYKKALKERIKTPLSKKKSINLKKLAGFLGIQYTFLSKCLNSETTHLNEDHLYRACEYLNLSEDEKDFLLLLRQRDVSSNSQRKEFLSKKIEKMRNSHVLQGDIKDQHDKAVSHETELLLEPMCDLVYLCLNIDLFKKDPRRLPRQLGISIEKLKIILDTLEKNQLIIRESEFEIKKVVLPVIHRPRTHPLVRAHQQLLKSQLQQKLFQSNEDSKESFIFSFNGNQKTFDLAKKEFQNLIKKVQQDSLNEKPTEVFQMSFDLVKWT